MPCYSAVCVLMLEYRGQQSPSLYEVITSCLPSYFFFLRPHMADFKW